MDSKYTPIETENHVIEVHQNAVSITKKNDPHDGVCLNFQEANTVLAFLFVLKHDRLVSACVEQYNSLICPVCWAAPGLCKGHTPDVTH